MTCFLLDRRRTLLAAVTACLLARFSFAEDRPTAGLEPIEVTKRAIAIHRTAPVIDGHNDLPWALRGAGKSPATIDLREPAPQFHTDIERLRAGGVGAQFWSVYVPVSTMQQGSALTTTLEQIEMVRQLATVYDDVFELALTTEDIERIRSEGKIASMIGVEGGHSIENSIGVLRQLYEQGARYMTLTHSKSLPWADSCSDESVAGGLSPFGKQVVREMNRLGMLVDLSHVSPQTMHDALDVSVAPVIFSHSSAKQIADHPRNVPDDVLKRMKENGGVVMINFFPDFVHPANADRSNRRTQMKAKLAWTYADDQEEADAELARWERANPRANVCTAADVLDHIDHVVKVAGVDHVGLGSDYDGVPALPRQLQDVSTYPVLTQGMLDRGYSEPEIRKILGGNIMRVFREAEASAGRIMEEQKRSE